MTRDEAISIRQAQLEGRRVSDADLDEAMRTIQATNSKTKSLYADGTPRKVLQRLAAGPVDRSDFFGEMGQNSTKYTAVRRLVNAGLIRCEVSLTEDGLRALGLVGPRL